MDRSRFLSILFGSIVLLGSLVNAPSARAETTPTWQSQLAAYGPGTKADKAIAKTVTATIKQFVKLVNARDEAAVDLLDPSMWQNGSRDQEIGVLQRQIKVKIYQTGDVQEHPDAGVVSIKVSSSGWYTASSYYTERWILVYRSESDSYAISQFIQIPAEVVDQFIPASVRLIFSEKRLSLKPISVEAATLLLIDTVSHGKRWLSTGIYELTDDLSIEEAQAMVSEDYRSLPFIGATPIRAGEEFTFGLLVKPGKQYLITEYTLDDQGGSPAPLAGEQYAAVLTIQEQAPEDATPIGSSEA